jgi:hypothetical protein
MQDAAYFRSRAEMYFELARRMSLHVDSEFFCIQAEHCLARATELEAEDSSVAPPTRQ